MEKSRSFSQAAGLMISGTTRSLKDWEEAADLDARGRRFEERRRRAVRRGTWSDGAYGKVGSGGPVVRGELHDIVDGYRSHKGGECAEPTWHDKLVQAALKRLDRKGVGEVSLRDLRNSFVQIGLPLDDKTFTRYAEKLLPEEGGDGVSAKDFMAFHRTVWANQPTAVRRFAGDPEADPAFSAAAEDLGRPISPAGPRQTHGLALPRGLDKALATKSVLLERPGATGGLSKSASAPSGCFLKEVRTNEDMLRIAFLHHAGGRRYLFRRDMPSVFKALGLDCDVSNGTKESKWFGEFCDSQFAEADINDDGRISFHEFVDYHNKYIVHLECQRDSDMINNV